MPTSSLRDVGKGLQVEEDSRLGGVEPSMIRPGCLCAFGFALNACILRRWVSNGFPRWAAISYHT
jgi:hypothetical protein